MIKENGFPEKRKLKEIKVETDLIIVGGGMAGTCCAITAARAGLRVTLVQDRPVLGGNASSEIRLWILGATSHMGNNNRWAREGGVIDEILVENLYRNPEGNPLILDTILLEKVTLEPSIKLLLNTAVHDLEKKGDDEISCAHAFCSQNSTSYALYAPFFVDASGDGILGFLAGAAFRMGAEKADEFDEAFAPDHGYGELLGHSLYFYSKATDKPVRFIAPSYAHKALADLPRFRSFNMKDHGCRLWWVEYGGRMDTIHESETIKWELWKVIYAIWDHIKNSGEFPDMTNHTLEWVGTIPGKRESRRFEGDYMLHQKDLVEQREHADAVSFGGWALDLHPADGVYGDKPGCTQWHAKGVYQIPFRTMYSRNINNLFLGGRSISASHVAFGSSRVMATCAHNAQAVALAAKLCVEHNLYPKDISAPKWIKILQKDLLKTGHYIPKLNLEDSEELVQHATLKSSSTFQLQKFPADGPWKHLEFSMAQLVPFPAGQIPEMSVPIKASEPTTIHLQLLAASKPGNFTPDVVLEEQWIEINKGENQTSFSFDYELVDPGYLFLAFHANSLVEVKCTQQRVSGLLTVFQKFNKAVAVSSRQEPPESIGIDAFDFWLPERRPGGHNLAITFSKPLDIFPTQHLTNGVFRPSLLSNCWVADPSDSEPSLDIIWDKKQNISEIKLFFDTDSDHPMESTLMGHPESEIPFCVPYVKICAGTGDLLAEIKDNHQSVFTLTLKEAVETKQLKIYLQHPSAQVPASLFGVLCY
ncbi:FAD-dependent oxidoreductase [Lunatibacter salilacus]|uniref:FAD-dependent oxidoreductase n=1 Tax=Lunatibacter salilacus TaxID=2483804 RepID=UPI00131D5EB5|nr:FAD-dependent oxidoreductase [Lunatibacter salilacus]